MFILIIGSFGCSSSGYISPQETDPSLPPGSPESKHLDQSTMPPVILDINEIGDVSESNDLNNSVDSIKPHDSNESENPNDPYSSDRSGDYNDPYGSPEKGNTGSTLRPMSELMNPEIYEAIGDPVQSDSNTKNGTNEQKSEMLRGINKYKKEKGYPLIDSLDPSLCTIAQYHARNMAGKSNGYPSGFGFYETIGYDSFDPQKNKYSEYGYLAAESLIDIAEKNTVLGIGIASKNDRLYWVIIGY